VRRISIRNEKENLINYLDPLEANYKKLNTQLEHIPPSSDEFAVIANYIEKTQDTKNAAYKLELMQAFTVERDGEADRFEKFKKTPNRILEDSR
jgi:hypothetical protein